MKIKILLCTFMIMSSHILSISMKNKDTAEVSAISTTINDLITKEGLKDCKLTIDDKLGESVKALMDRFNAYDFTPEFRAEIDNIVKDYTSGSTFGKLKQKASELAGKAVKKTKELFGAAKTNLISLGSKIGAFFKGEKRRDGDKKEEEEPRFFKIAKNEEFRKFLQEFLKENENKALDKFISDFTSCLEKETKGDKKEGDATAPAAKERKFDAGVFKGFGGASLSIGGAILGGIGDAIATAVLTLFAIIGVILGIVIYFFGIWPVVYLAIGIATIIMVVAMVKKGPIKFFGDLLKGIKNFIRDRIVDILEALTNVIKKVK